MSSFEQRINAFADKAEKWLRDASFSGADGQKVVADAMNYSLMAGGKRVRMLLCDEFCRICGGTDEMARSAACAVEMVHTYSLIHDDLPCMDNDDFRRGMPSCHKAYGEAQALLAGDGLLTAAFELILSDETLSYGTRTALACELAHAAGLKGMIGGQAVDITPDADVTADKLIRMYNMKTGAIISAACRMGCISVGADKMHIEAAGRYGINLGAAFQIVDDILDIRGDEKLLGKPVNSDEKNCKPTYASLNGIDNAEISARRYTESALTELELFNDSAFIKEYTLQLLGRNK